MHKGTGNRETDLRCVIIEFVVCEHKQNGAPDWVILSHARQRFRGTKKLTQLLTTIRTNFSRKTINSYIYLKKKPVINNKSADMQMHNESE